MLKPISIKLKSSSNSDAAAITLIGLLYIIYFPSSSALNREMKWTQNFTGELEGSWAVSKNKITTQIAKIKEK